MMHVLELCPFVQYLHTVSFNDVMEAKKTYMELLKDYWYNENYRTFNWWLLVSISVVPAIIWWVAVDKKRIIEITAFGLFYGVAAIILDSIGTNAMVWAYPVILTPYLNPQFYPYDVGAVIIPFMLVYQGWGRHFKKFLMSTGLLSLFLAFAAEPGMVLLGIYQEITWKHIYSFFIYWLLGLICWWIIKQFKSMENNH